MIVGVVCDNYKESEYLKRLSDAGLTEINVSDFGPSCKTIKITIPNRDKVNLIKQICDKAEQHFAKPERNKYS